MHDDQGRSNQSALTWTVEDVTAASTPAADERELTITPDKTLYGPRETAHLLVRSPHADAEGLLVLGRNGLVHTQRFRLRGTSAVLDVPLAEELAPNLHATVMLARSPHPVPGSARIASEFAFRQSTRSQASARVAHVDLRIDPVTMRLAVRATPRSATVRPGSRTSITVDVCDVFARPAVGAEVALVVVDESVLDLVRYLLVNPINTFYTEQERALAISGGLPEFVDVNRDLVAAQPENRIVIPSTRSRRGRPGSRGVRVSIRYVGADLVDVIKSLAAKMDLDVIMDGTVKGRVTIALKDVPAEAALSTLLKIAGFDCKIVGRTLLVGSRSSLERIPDAIFSEQALRHRGGDETSVEFAALAVRARQDMRALALFCGALHTDANGRATVDLTMPDTLTRYRVMAVASSGEGKFGIGRNAISARTPLSIRVNPPRFAFPGDRFDIPVVVQNETEQAQKVQVAARISSRSRLLGAPGGEVTLAPMERVTIPVQVEAVSVGTLQVQAAAVSARNVDAAVAELPVRQARPRQAAASCGTLTEGSAAVPVTLPPGASPEGGSLEITASATMLGPLSDVLDLFEEYRFDCSEQVASRLLAEAAVLPLADRVPDAHLPSARVLAARAQRDLLTLEKRQRADGSFCLWKNDERRWAFLDVHVAHALVFARQHGIPVQPQVIARAARRLRSLPRDLDATRRSDRSVLAYAASVLHLLEPGDVALARRVIRDGHVRDLSFEQMAWLLPVLARDPEARQALAAIRQRLANAVRETAATAHFDASQGDDDWLTLSSARRTDALLLDALLHVAPTDPLVPRLVGGLLEARRQDYGLSTMEDAFVLVALEHYARIYEKPGHSLAATVRVGSTPAGVLRLDPRPANRQSVSLPLTRLADPGAREVVIGHQGVGRLYYRVLMRYVEQCVASPPVDHGLETRREYEPVDDTDSVRRAADGTWHIRAGARIRIRVSVRTPAARHHVAVEIPLPAGFEPIDASLHGSEPGSAPSAAGFFDHSEIHDERINAFAFTLPRGLHTFDTVVRATTTGDFFVPGAHGEDMYHPDIFGRSACDRVSVEP